MTQEELKITEKLLDIHFLLQRSKASLRYPQQRKRWNEIQARMREENKLLEWPIADATDAPLSLTEGIYQD